MYLFDMDRVAREDIAAAAAVRQELGSGYDDVLAEGLIERIGAEIDRRIDARLDGRRRIRRANVADLERRGTLWKGAAVGAAVTGLPAIMISLANPFRSMGAIIMIVLAWLVIAVGYGIVTWAYSMRQRDD
jgi:hypothetical protein